MSQNLCRNVMNIILIATCCMKQRKLQQSIIENMERTRQTLFIYSLAFNIISLSHIIHTITFFKVGNYGKCRAGLEEPTWKRMN